MTTQSIMVGGIDMLALSSKVPPPLVDIFRPRRPAVATSLTDRGVATLNAGHQVLALVVSTPSKTIRNVARAVCM